MIGRWRAVDLRDEERDAAVAIACEQREPVGKRPRGDRSGGLVLGKEHEQLARAAAQVRSQRPADQDHEGADRTRRTASGVDTLRPLQDRAVRVGRIRRGQHDDLGLVGRLLERSQEVQRCGQRELRAPTPATK